MDLALPRSLVPVVHRNDQHGFTRVDDEARPADWVECLDRLHGEPFYRHYKRRVRELIAPRPAGLYLEVGAGAGTDALALGARVVGIDRSLTMSREARMRGLTMSVVADAMHLPLRSASVDGCWSDRTFQHLADPQSALNELVRVMKPGATIVVVDPDYGTQKMNFPDQDLASKVMRFRADHLLRNGRLAHQMARLFEEAALDDVSVDEKLLVVTEPTSVDNVMGLRSWARTAMDRGLMTGTEVDRWETSYDAVIADGAFLWSISFFITSGRKASGPVS